MPGGTILSILSESGVNPNTCGRANSISIRCDHITCGRGYFRTRKEKVGDSKISGYVWKGFKSSPLTRITITMMMLISSFRSRAQIVQLIAETPNQITNKNKHAKMFNTVVCLGGMPNIHINFGKLKKKNLFLR